MCKLLNKGERNAYFEDEWLGLYYLRGGNDDFCMVESLLIESLLRIGSVDCNFNVAYPKDHTVKHNEYAIIASTVHALHLLSKITKLIFQQCHKH